VIASLVYLATQIRQSREQMGANTRAVRASTQHDIFENLNDISMRPFGDPANYEAIRIGMADYEQLAEADRLRFHFWAGGLLLGYENAYYQYRSGLLDEDRWNFYRDQLASLFQNVAPGFTQWWRISALPWTPEFVALVEEILGEEGEGADGEQG
jgi:hypothetical protein